jgi:Luciferase-like monooxygenase
MKPSSDIVLSVLDLASVREGGTVAESFRNSLTLAQHTEKWGYRRFWLAEHHNLVGIASAATSVLIGHVAGGTKTIRVGSGGIMLPNHAPLMIAEQFGTLEALCSEALASARWWKPAVCSNRIFWLKSTSASFLETFANRSTRQQS